MNEGIDHQDDTTDTEDEVWDDVVYHDEAQQQQSISLEGMDYLALFIASMQTIFLPIIILIIVFLAFGIGFAILF